MNIWEIALLIFAATYFMVNTVYLVITVKLMTTMKGVYSKSLKLCEKMMEETEKEYLDD